MGGNKFTGNHLTGTMLPEQNCWEQSYRSPSFRHFPRRRNCEYALFLRPFNTRKARDVGKNPRKDRRKIIRYIQLVTSIKTKAPDRFYSDFVKPYTFSPIGHWKILWSPLDSQLQNVQVEPELYRCIHRTFLSCESLTNQEKRKHQVYLFFYIVGYASERIVESLFSSFYNLHVAIRFRRSLLIAERSSHSSQGLPRSTPQCKCSDRASGNWRRVILPRKASVVTWKTYESCNLLVFHFGEICNLCGVLIWYG